MVAFSIILVALLVAIYGLPIWRCQYEYKGGWVTMTDGNYKTLFSAWRFMNQMHIHNFCNDKRIVLAFLN